jgi:hypothetical protein
MAPEQRLVGKTIRKVFVSDDQGVLWFECADGGFGLETEADCCSETWFADITGFDALPGGVVQSVEELDMTEYNVNDGRTRQEYDQAYGFSIKTDKGTATIAYRNSSNGYYGGCLKDSQPSKPDALKEITDDWSA